MRLALSFTMTPGRFLIHVDDVERTWAAEPVETLMARRRVELAADIEDVKLPHAEYSVTT